MKLLTQDHYIQMPWKNGLGVTTELFKVVSEEKILLRISSAKVDRSGPFSVFENYDRTLVNFGPGTMKITVGGAIPVVLPPCGVIDFDGSHQTTCEIDLPSCDFNVFCLSPIISSTTEVLDVASAQKIPLHGDQNLFLYVVKGAIKCVSTRNALIGTVDAGGSILSEPLRLSDDAWELSPNSEETNQIIIVRWKYKNKNV